MTVFPGQPSVLLEVNSECCGPILLAEQLKMLFGFLKKLFSCVVTKSVVIRHQGANVLINSFNTDYS